MSLLLSKKPTIFQVLKSPQVAPQPPYHVQSPFAQLQEAVAGKQQKPLDLAERNALQELDRQNLATQQQNKAISEENTTLKQIIEKQQLKIKQHEDEIQSLVVQRANAEATADVLRRKDAANAYLNKLRLEERGRVGEALDSLRMRIRRLLQGSEGPNGARKDEMMLQHLMNELGEIEEELAKTKDQNEALKQRSQVLQAELAAEHQKAAEKPLQQQLELDAQVFVKYLQDGELSEDMIAALDRVKELLCTGAFDSWFSVVKPRFTTMSCQTDYVVIGGQQTAADFLKASIPSKPQLQMEPITQKMVPVKHEVPHKDESVQVQPKLFFTAQQTDPPDVVDDWTYMPPPPQLVPPLDIPALKTSPPEARAADSPRLRKGKLGNSSRDMGHNLKNEQKSQDQLLEKIEDKAQPVEKPPQLTKQNTGLKHQKSKLGAKITADENVDIKIQSNRESVVTSNSPSKFAGKLENMSAVESIIDVEVIRAKSRELSPTQKLHLKLERLSLDKVHGAHCVNPVVKLDPAIKYVQCELDFELRQAQQSKDGPKPQRQLDQRTLQMIKNMSFSKEPLKTEAPQQQAQAGQIDLSQQRNQLQEALLSSRIAVGSKESKNAFARGKEPDGLRIASNAQLESESESEVVLMDPETAASKLQHASQTNLLKLKKVPKDNLQNATNKIKKTIKEHGDGSPKKEIAVAKIGDGLREEGDLAKNTEISNLKSQLTASQQQIELLKIAASKTAVVAVQGGLEKKTTLTKSQIQFMTLSDLHTKQENETQTAVKVVEAAVQTDEDVEQLAKKNASFAFMRNLFDSSANNVQEQLKKIDEQFQLSELGQKPEQGPTEPHNSQNLSPKVNQAEKSQFSFQLGLSDRQNLLDTIKGQYTQKTELAELHTEIVETQKKDRGYQMPLCPRLRICIQQYNILENLEKHVFITENEVESLSQFFYAAGESRAALPFLKKGAVQELSDAAIAIIFKQLLKSASFEKLSIQTSFGAVRELKSIYPQQGENVPLICAAQLGSLLQIQSVFDDELEIETVNGQKYIKTGMDNVLFRESAWVQKMISKILESFQTVLYDDQQLNALLFVRQYMHLSFSNVQCKQQTLQLLANIAHWQHFLPDVYLFKQLLFKLEPDFWLTFNEMHRFCVTRKQSFWILRRDILNRFFGNLNSQQQSKINAFIESNHEQFCAGILMNAIATQRRKGYKTSLAIMDLLKREQNVARISHSAFSVYCELAQLRLSPTSIRDYFTAYSTDGWMTQTQFDSFFVQNQLHKQCNLQDYLLQEATSPALKKLMFQTTYVAKMLKDVAEQVIKSIQMHSIIDPRLGKFVFKIDQEYQNANAQIAIFDYDSAILHLKNVVGFLVDVLLIIKPDSCVAAIGGAVSSLNAFLVQQ